MLKTYRCIKWLRLHSFCLMVRFEQTIAEHPAMRSWRFYGIVFDAEDMYYLLRGLGLRKRPWANKVINEIDQKNVNYEEVDANNLFDIEHHWHDIEKDLDDFLSDGPSEKLYESLEEALFSNIQLPNDSYVSPENREAIREFRRGSRLSNHIGKLDSGTVKEIISYLQITAESMLQEDKNETRKEFKVFKITELPHDLAGPTWDEDDGAVAIGVRRHWVYQNHIPSLAKKIVDVAITRIIDAIRRNHLRHDEETLLNKCHQQYFNFPPECRCCVIERNGMLYHT